MHGEIVKTNMADPTWLDTIKLPVMLRLRTRDGIEGAVVGELRASLDGPIPYNMEVTNTHDGIVMRGVVMLTREAVLEQFEPVAAPDFPKPIYNAAGVLIGHSLAHVRDGERERPAAERLVDHCPGPHCGRLVLFSDRIDATSQQCRWCGWISGRACCGSTGYGHAPDCEHYAATPRPTMRDTINDAFAIDIATGESTNATHDDSLARASAAQDTHWARQPYPVVVDGMSFVESPLRQLIEREWARHAAQSGHPLRKAFRDFALNRFQMPTHDVPDRPRASLIDDALDAGVAPTLAPTRPYPALISVAPTDAAKVTPDGIESYGPYRISGKCYRCGRLNRDGEGNERECEGTRDAPPVCDECRARVAPTIRGAS